MGTVHGSTETATEWKDLTFGDLKVELPSAALLLTPPPGLINPGFIN